jgi:hypothetical protein
MSRPRDPTSENDILIGVVVGGHDADPDPNQNGLCRIYCPQIHGNSVKKEDLGFSMMVMPPNQAGATSFNGIPDPGQHMLCLRTKNGPTGDTSLIALGSFPTNRQDGGQPGNKNLNTYLNALTWAFGAPINVPIAPNVVEVVEGGTRIRKIQEKGQLHNHDLLKGIPSHGATYNLAGMPLKQITNVSTATQAFSNILTGSMLSALPGMNFSVGNILSSLTSSALDELLSSLSPELAQGMQNMFNLMQTMQTMEGGGFTTAGKVDPTTYLANAVSLLKGNQSLGEMISNIQRLQSDVSLFGIDKLASTPFAVATAFGAITMNLSATGAIQMVTPEPVQKAIEAFGSLMSAGAGFPGASLGNMFGSSSGVMSEMFNRLPPDKQTIAKTMMETVIAPGTQARTLLNTANELAQKGSNIFGLLK